MASKERGSILLYSQTADTILSHPELRVLSGEVDESAGDATTSTSGNLLYVVVCQYVYAIPQYLMVVIIIL